MNTNLAGPKSVQPPAGGPANAGARLAGRRLNPQFQRVMQLPTLSPGERNRVILPGTSPVQGLRGSTTTLKAAGVLSGLWLVAATSAIGLGADHPKGQPVGSSSAWPPGMRELVNATNRVHGFFVNAQDVFFYSGSAGDLTAFLQKYLEIQGIEAHRLILHDGGGEAKSPWDKTGQPCDWKLTGCPRAWLKAADPDGAGAVGNTNYVLEVHVWTGGRIALEDVRIPGCIEFAGECFRQFESITNGMTRAQVESRLEMDGGLQGVSPVRFIDPGCPGFKINVEFAFKKDAANQGRGIWGQDDKVVRVTKPYREPAYRD